MKAATWIVLMVVMVLTGMFVVTGLSGWLVGLIMALVVFSVARTAREDVDSFGDDVPRAFRGAPIGIGTVVSTTRTGLSIDEQHQLDIVLNVDTPDGAFRGVARLIIDLAELAAVRPGAMLPVRYRPGRTDGKVALATDSSWAEIQAVLDRIQLT